MHGYSTYKWKKEKNAFVFAPDLDFLNDIEDPVTEQYLLDLGYVPTPVPVWTSKAISKRVLFVHPEYNLLAYGPATLDMYDDVMNIEELQKSIAGLHPSQEFEILNNVHTSVVFHKSLYNFDLSSLEGVKNTLQTLPVMDTELLAQIVQSIWPGLDTTTYTPKELKAQVRGYLLDLLVESNAVDK